MDGQRDKDESRLCHACVGWVGARAWSVPTRMTGIRSWSQASLVQGSVVRIEKLRSVLRWPSSYHSSYRHAMNIRAPPLLAQSGETCSAKPRRDKAQKARVGRTQLGKRLKRRWLGVRAHLKCTNQGCLWVLGPVKTPAGRPSRSSHSKKPLEISTQCFLPRIPAHVPPPPSSERPGVDCGGIGGTHRDRWR